MNNIAVKEVSMDNDTSNGEKIYCANCIHCKLVRIPAGNGNQYYLRVKVYKYFTVARRTINHCDAYEPMGDTKTFLKELKKNLPIKDEIYSY